MAYDCARRARKNFSCLISSKSQECLRYWKYIDKLMVLWQKGALRQRSTSAPRRPSIIGNKGAFYQHLVPHGRLSRQKLLLKQQKFLLAVKASSSTDGAF